MNNYQFNPYSNFRLSIKAIPILCINCCEDVHYNKNNDVSVIADLLFLL